MQDNFGLKDYQTVRLNAQAIPCIDKPLFFYA